jgi:N,N-dimethylformamidase
VLATSQGRHSDAYLLVVEDIPNTTTKVTGTTSPLIRADMVYFELPRGGAVFSVGSICWLGSLSHHRYANNVSRITENVLRHFAS